MIKTLEWTDAGVRFIDQTKLPTEETYVTCKNYEEVADAIRTMVVRGAPAIGVAAGMGVALGTLQSRAQTLPELERDFDAICNVLAGTRPTAVNLFWAIRRMRDKFDQLRALPVEKIKAEMVAEAQRMHVEDIAANEAMGKHGAVLLPSAGAVLTHCNAGASGDCGVWNRAGRDSCGNRVRQEAECLCRRDAAVPAGVSSDSVGVDERRDSYHADSRQHGGRDDASRQDRRGPCGR